MQIEPLKQKYEQCLRDFLTQLRAIHIDQLERKWITISLLMIGLFVGIITIDAFFHGVNPPSKVETIDSASLHLNKEFAEDNLGVQVDDKGAIIIRMVAGRYSFFPNVLNLSLGEHGRFAWCAYSHDQHEHHDCAGLCRRNNHHHSKTRRISCAV